MKVLLVSIAGSAEAFYAEALAQEISALLAIHQGPLKSKQARRRTALLLGTSAAALLALYSKCRRVVRVTH